MYVNDFYKGVCQYCGAKDGNEMDHILPKRWSWHKERCISNVIAACTRCNREKSGWFLVQEQHDIAVALATFVAPAIMHLMSRSPLPGNFPSADHLPRPKLILDKSAPWFRPRIRKEK